MQSGKDTDYNNSGIIVNNTVSVITDHWKTAVIKITSFLQTASSQVLFLCQLRKWICPNNKDFSSPRLLSELFPGAAELYERVAANREQWTKVSHKFTIRGLPSNNSLDFLDQEYELLQSQGDSTSDGQCLNGCLENAEGRRCQ